MGTLAAALGLPRRAPQGQEASGRRLAERVERYLRLPFTLRPDRMDEALDRLAAAWGDLDRLGLGAETEPSAVA